MFQVRRKEPRAGHRDKFYTPERDLAHAGPMLVSSAVHSFDNLAKEPWFDAYLEQQHITMADLVDGARRLALAMGTIIQQKTPQEALAASGFADVPMPVQVVFYTALGRTLLAAIWIGVKDVSRPDDGPPLSFQDLLDETEEVCRLLADGKLTSTTLPTDTAHGDMAPCGGSAKAGNAGTDAGSPVEG